MCTYSVGDLSIQFLPQFGYVDVSVVVSDVEVLRPLFAVEALSELEGEDGVHGDVGVGVDKVLLDHVAVHLLLLCQLFLEFT